MAKGNEESGPYFVGLNGHRTYCASCMRYFCEELPCIGMGE